MQTYLEAVMIAEAEIISLISLKVSLRYISEIGAITRMSKMYLLNDKKIIL